MFTAAMSPTWDDLVSAGSDLEDTLNRMVPAQACRIRKRQAVNVVFFLLFLTCNLSQGSKSLILIGQTGSGKSTLGNALVSGKPNKGPFTVGTSMSSETQHVGTKYSEKLDLYVTDTPGLFDYKAGASREELERVSNEHMGSVTQCLRNDGGRILWLISDCARITSQMRATIRALSLCNPNWPLHTMVVAKACSPAKFEEVEEEVREERSNLNDSSVREAAASRYDALQLGELNSALRTEGVSFFYFTTYVVGSAAFNMARMVDRVRNFVLESIPLPPNCFMSWEDLLGSLMKRQEEKVKAEEELLNGQILPLQVQVEYHRACAKKLRDARIDARKQWWMRTFLGWLFFGGVYDIAMEKHEFMALQEDSDADNKHQLIEKMKEESHQKVAMIAEEMAREITRIRGLVSDNL